MSNLLDNYKDINDVKKMSLNQKKKLAREIRKFLIDKVSKTGGHLASNLGVVELTLSLFSVFDLNYDKLIWDVGHQAYVHKILTGRKDKFDTLRQFGGLSGFPKRCESIYDFFETGHSSTSISAALGMARARDLKHEKYNVVAVIGDGALTGGMALEALNDVGYRKTKLIIILNDNQMSIGKNVGGVSKYLNRLRVDPKYNKFKADVEAKLKKIPNIGTGMAKYLEKLKNGIKQMVVPGMFFEDMGIKYLGPIDGHNIKELTDVLTSAKDIQGPVIIHIITKKGKGYEFAEKNPDKFHGIGPFNCANGELATGSSNTYSKAFGNEMVKLAEKETVYSEGPGSSWHLYCWLPGDKGALLTGDGGYKILNFTEGKYRSIEGPGGFVPAKNGWLDEYRIAGTVTLTSPTGEKLAVFILDTRDMSAVHTGLEFTEGVVLGKTVYFFLDGDLRVYALQ